jgi:hypothetical protein
VGWGLWFRSLDDDKGYATILKRKLQSLNKVAGGCKTCRQLLNLLAATGHL